MPDKESPPQDYFVENGTKKGEHPSQKDKNGYVRLEGDSEKYSDKKPSVIRYKIKIKKVDE